MDVEQLVKGVAKEVLNKYVDAIKKKIIIIVAAVVLVLILLFAICGGGAAQNVSAASNSDGMSSASTGGTGASASGAWAGINLYNDDGSVNETAIDQLQLAFETEFNLVRGSLSGDNIGGRYNPTTCQVVTGTYLGWDGKEEGYSTSYEDAVVAGIQYKGKNGLGVYQCTWWANGRASEYLGRQFNVGGNGGDIYVNAAGKYERGSTPKSNSLVSYTSPNSEYGHVAYVEAVDNVNGYYYISHAGSGKSWYGIQKVAIGQGPWSSYSIVGFVYLDQPIN